MGLYKQGKRWWIDEILPNGQRVQKSLRTTDKRLAEARATELRDEILEKERRRRKGLPDDSSHEATASRKPLDLVEEYLGELERRGRAKLHVDITGTRLRRLLDGVGRLADLSTAENVRAALVRASTTVSQGFAKEGEERKTMVVSARTQNYYRLALSAFFNWLLREGRWPSNPVKSIARVTEGESNRRRRALTPNEVQRLLRAVAKVPGTRARERRVCYLLAYTRQLRRGTLRGLLVGDVDLEAGTLRIRASIAKNRKDRVKALAPEILEELRALCAGRETTKPLFRAVPRMKTFRRDLRRARIPEVTPEGVADFHGLARTSAATTLANEGVPLTTSQKMLDHSSPALTSGAYTRTGLDEERAAASKLARLALGPHDAAPETLGEILGSQGRKHAETRGFSGPPSVDDSGSPEMQRAKAQGLGSWTDPDLNRGHQDFQSWRPTPVRPGEMRDGPGSRDDPRRNPREQVRHDGVGQGPEDLARALLVQAATAPDPAPLIAAAQVLLEQAARERENVVKLQDVRRSRG